MFLACVVCTLSTVCQNVFFRGILCVWFTAFIHEWNMVSYECVIVSRETIGHEWIWIFMQQGRSLWKLSVGTCNVKRICNAHLNFLPIPFPVVRKNSVVHRDALGVCAQERKRKSMCVCGFVISSGAHTEGHCRQFTNLYREQQK